MPAFIPGSAARTNMNNSSDWDPAVSSRVRMEGARRGKALVIGLVGGGTLLALIATVYILGTWGK